MTWFKVDDKFHSHAKVARLGDDSDALALWVVAGSWCADQLTDGWVPAFVARRLDPDYMRRAAALVRVGLWEEEQRDDEKGWVFHGWNEEGRQPTAEQVQQERAAKSARQQRWRERMRAERQARGVDASTHRDVDADVDVDPDYDAYEGQHEANSRSGRTSTSASTRSGARTGGAGQTLEGRRDVDASTRRPGDGGVDGAPTRPDPTIDKEQNLSPSADAEGVLFGGGEPKKRPDPMARFAEFWAIYPLKKGKPAAEKNWAKAVRGGADPQAIIDGAKVYALECRTKEPDKIKYPQGWLTDGRWMDEAAPALPGMSSAAPSRPEAPWCGACNKLTRQIENDRDLLVPCPTCSPHRRNP